jgi:hypothetical protein
LSRSAELVSNDAVLLLDSHIMKKQITLQWLNVQHGLEIVKKF